MNHLKTTNLSFFTLAITLFLGVTASGQTSEEVRSDRPGLSNSAFSVGKQQLQFQAGYQADFDRIVYTDVNGNVVSTDYFDAQNSSLVVRYGLTERFEINVFSAFNHTSGLNFANSLGFSGLSLRGNLYSGDGLITAIGGQVDFSYLSRDFGITTSDALQAGVRLSAQSTINETFGFTTNLGFSNTRMNNLFYPTIDRQNFYYTLNLGAGFGKWSCFAEYLGSYSISYNSTIDVGGAYLCGNNFQFDFYGGLNALFSGSANPFVSAGITYRLSFNKE